MAHIPCTLIIKLLDKVNFNMDEAEVVFREMFSYGVKQMVKRGDKFYIQLTYTPKHANLLFKFGNLPIQYLRTKMDNMERDLKLFESSMKKYKFNLRAPDEEEAAAAALPAGSSNKKRLLNYEDTDDEKAGPSKSLLLPIPSSDSEDNDIPPPLPPKPKKKPLPVVSIDEESQHFMDNLDY